MWARLRLPRLSPEKRQRSRGGRVEREMTQVCARPDQTSFPPEPTLIGLRLPVVELFAASDQQPRKRQAVKELTMMGIHGGLEDVRQLRRQSGQPGAGDRPRGCLPAGSRVGVQHQTGSQRGRPLMRGGIHEDFSIL